MDKHNKINEGNKKCYFSRNESFISMWINGDFKICDMYERGNYSARIDAAKYLQQYADKFKWPKSKARVLDVGSGDGSVTKVMSEFIPKGCELIGSDIDENVVKYANQKYANERIRFVPFDVLGEIPDDIKGTVDYVFASYLFHWVRDHETAFTNIYNILPKQGQFFSTFLAACDVYSIFKILSKRNRWAQWMELVDQFTSPYFDFQDPDDHLSNTLKKVGFEFVDVKCKQSFFVHDDPEDFKSLITGINCFEIPEHLWPDFLDDFVEVKRYMNLVDDKGAVRTNYNLLVLHCTK